MTYQNGLCMCDKLFLLNWVCLIN